MKANGKHELDRLAAKFAAQRANSLVLQPDAANETSQAAFQAEYSNVWTLREQLLVAALDGGQPATLGTLDACEELALECVRRRVSESLKIARLTNGKAGPAFKFVAEAVGIDVDAELKGEPVNLHG